MNRKGLFSQVVTTFDEWIAELWELYGDGRSVVDGTCREVLLWAAFRNVYGCIPTGGTVSLGAKCVAQASGIEEFEEALESARRGRALAVVSAEELLFLKGLAAYEDTLRDLGLIERGNVQAGLTESCDEVFARPISVLVEEAPPLGELEKRFFSSENLQVSISYAPGPEGIPAAPEQVEVRFAFPSGRLAQPSLVADVIESCAPRGDVVVASKDPLDMYERLADRLAQRGLSACVEAHRPFSQTDFGRAYLAMCRCTSPQTWDPAALSDVVFSPFSGLSFAQAVLFDERLRRDRIVSREEALAELRAISEPFSQFEELAEDPQADVLAGVFEQAVQAAVRRSEAWRAEQLHAIARLRSVTRVARMAGVGIEACRTVLKRSQVPVGMRIGGSGDSVLFTTMGNAASLGERSCETLILTDLTAQDYPVADRDDAAVTLLASLGVPAGEDALSRARREFSSLLHVPRRTLCLVRPLADDDANATYPCVVVEEFVDAYRADLSATADLENDFRLPSGFREGAWQRGEETLYANAEVVSAACRQAGAVETRLPVQSLGANRVKPFRRAKLDSEGRVLDGLWVSPSQIEVYLECPFKWFVQYRLHPDGIDEGFGAMERGQFAHRVFETFYRRFPECGWAKVTDDNCQQAKELMRQIAAELMAEQPHEEPGSGRLVAASQLERLDAEAFSEQLVSFVDFEKQLLPGFSPAYLEYEIGPDQLVEYAGGWLSGKVDRIDVDDCGHAVILDYKGSLGVEHEIADKARGHQGKVQALIYAQAVRRHLGLDVVGALYVSYGKRPALSGAFDSRVVEAAHLPGMRHERCACGSLDEAPVGAPEDFPLADLSFRALLDEVEDAVGRALAAVRSGDVDPSPSHAGACEYCPVVSCPKRGA